jgi:hypothetical protein
MTAQDVDNAKKLLAGAQVFATNSREGFTAQYPTLDNVDLDEWQSLLMIAATGTALLMIPVRYTSEDKKELTANVVATLRDWNEGAMQQLSDFIGVASSGAKSPEEVPDVIGSWVLRNIQLTEPEQSAPRVIGMILLNTFGPWWDQ